MNNHNQAIKFCGICGKKRVYKDYHRLYNPCRICVAKRSARYYQAIRNKIIVRYKLYQENTKNVRKSLMQQKEELNKKVDELTRVMEK